MTDGRPTLSTINTSQTQHHKDEKTCTTLMTTRLSITTNHKNPILKYEGLGNQLMHEACVYLGEKAYWNKMVKGHWLLLKVLEVKFLKSLKVVGA
jgi:hypothetical protein